MHLPEPVRVPPRHESRGLPPGSPRQNCMAEDRLCSAAPIHAHAIRCARMTTKLARWGIQPRQTRRGLSGARASLRCAKLASMLCQARLARSARRLGSLTDRTNTALCRQEVRMPYPSSKSRCTKEEAHRLHLFPMLLLLLGYKKCFASAIFLLEVRRVERFVKIDAGLMVQPPYCNSLGVWPPIR